MYKLSGCKHIVFNVPEVIINDTGYGLIEFYKCPLCLNYSFSFEEIKEKKE